MGLNRQNSRTTSHRERVKRLLNHVNTLKHQVTERKSHAEQLMQAVLKEAFSAKKT
jgi:hypothetical protein